MTSLSFNLAALEGDKDWYIVLRVRTKASFKDYEHFFYEKHEARIYSW